MVQAIGLAWTGFHLAFSHWSDPMTSRHLMYEPGVLLIIVGFLITIAAIPVAQQVAQASDEDVQIPVYEPDGALSVQASGGMTLTAAGGRLARYSSERTHPATDQDQPAQSSGS